jgi:hypothetical protein
MIVTTTKLTTSSIAKAKTPRKNILEPRILEQLRFTYVVICYRDFPPVVYCNTPLDINISWLTVSLFCSRTLDVVQKRPANSMHERHHIVGRIEWFEQLGQFVIQHRRLALNNIEHLVVCGLQFKGKKPIRVARVELTERKAAMKQKMERILVRKFGAGIKLWNQAASATHTPQSVIFGLDKVQTKVFVVDNATRQVIDRCFFARLCVKFVLLGLNRSGLLCFVCHHQICQHEGISKRGSGSNSKTRTALLQHSG